MADAPFEITAFAWVPPFAQGVVRDLRVRWALEEAGLDYREDRFTIGDLMMATVLRGLRNTDFVTADPVLGPYLARCAARPAFQRALADQLAAFRENALRGESL